MTFDLTGIAPMQWVLSVNLKMLNTSQTLPIKYGKRSVDATDLITVEPGVYVVEWDTNLPDGTWKSFYFRDYSNFRSDLVSFGNLIPSGRRRVIIPEKATLRCYVSLDKQLSVVEPVLVVSLLPTSPLASAFDG